MDGQFAFYLLLLLSEEEGTHVQENALLVDLVVTLRVLLDCPAEVQLRRYMQFHAVGGGVEDADVVSVVLGVLEILAALVVYSRGGAVEKVFGSSVTLRACRGGGNAGVWLERDELWEGDAVGCCWGSVSVSGPFNWPP